MDVENLAMKSVGTSTGWLASLRAEQFGHDPTLFLLASPRAPEVLAPLDEREVGQWIDSLRERPEVSALLDAPSSNPGEHCVSVALRTDAEGRYAASVESLSEAARSTVPPTYRISIGGVPAVEVAIAKEMGAERSHLLPIIAGALAAVLLLLYRSPALVLGALLAPLAGVFLLDGLQGLLGLSVDPVSALLGPSVLTVGVASSVHVLERYKRSLREQVPKALASEQAVRQLRLPLLLTVATTVAGFMGLLTSPIPAVKRFGLLASAGIVIVVLITLLCLPSLLRLLHRPTVQDRQPVAEPGVGRFLPTRRAAILILGVSAFLGLAGSLFLAGNRVDSDPIHVLSADSLARRDSIRIARQLGGSEIFELLLPPGGPPTPIASIQLAAKVSNLDGVVGPAGPPRTSAQGYQLLTFLLAPRGSAAREALFARSEALASESGWIGAGATGLSVRVARDSNDLVRGQRRGILLTLAALWCVMSVGFRSPWLGLLGLLPNVLPLVILQGSMGAVGRPLTVASSMIGAVMLGLVVDDTIHLLHAYRKAAGTARQRVAEALDAVWRPIVITTVVLCTGFSATLLGELSATREFGALAAATLILAILADLLLLPALLVWARPRLTQLQSGASTCIENASTTS